MICGISEKKIIEQIDNKEIFKIICEIKNIDYESIIRDLIIRIKNSDIEDKDCYIGEQEIWDREYIHIIKQEDVLFINDDLLWSKEEAINFFKDDCEEEELKYLWIETTKEEKEVIKIAKECKTDIYVEAMR